jgi:peptidase M23-like protein
VRLRLSFLLAVCGASLVASGNAWAYPWPVKPFNKQHAVRANFGDPRTVFQLPLFQDGIDGPGDFNFHNGIDISAPDGTPVYPVLSGTVKKIEALEVSVDTPENRTFQYVHIVPIVHVGQQVVAKRTVVGYVARTYGHVHLTELRGTQVWNPLAKGGIAPYRDTIKPTISSITLRPWHELQDIDPLGVCGTVSLVSEIFDTPQLKVRGAFAGFPVSPALVTWALRRAVTGKVIVQTTTVADFRGTLPLPPEFWHVYARGTYQNAPRFGPRQFSLMPGRFIYELTPQGLDTRKLTNGVYQIIVRASDIRGNARTASQRFTVVNQAGTPTGCPATTPPPATPTTHTP